MGTPQPGGGGGKRRPAPLLGPAPRRPAGCIRMTGGYCGRCIAPRSVCRPAATSPGAACAAAATASSSSRHASAQERIAARLARRHISTRPPGALRTASCKRHGHANQRDQTAGAQVAVQDLCFLLQAPLAGATAAACRSMHDAPSLPDCMRHGSQQTSERLHLRQLYLCKANGRRRHHRAQATLGERRTAHAARRWARLNKNRIRGMGITHGEGQYVCGARVWNEGARRRLLKGATRKKRGEQGQKRQRRCMIQCRAGLVREGREGWRNAGENNAAQRGMKTWALDFVRSRLECKYRSGGISSASSVELAWGDRQAEKLQTIGV